MTAQFTFPPTLKDAFLFSIFSSTFITCSLFDGGHLDWYEVIDVGLVLPAAAPDLGRGVTPLVAAPDLGRWVSPLGRPP